MPNTSAFIFDTNICPIANGGAKWQTRKIPTESNFMIRVRVTNSEHEEFVKRAKENGYRSVSEFIRSLIEDEPERKKSVSRL